MQLTLPRRFFLLPLIAASSLFAQATPTAPKVNVVLATLTVNESIPRDQFLKVMPQEVSDTVALYLDGKIRQWYARGDGKGVVFLLDCGSVEEAKTIVERLPLMKAGFASFDYMPLGPLTPLRLLIAPPQAR